MDRLVLVAPDDEEKSVDAGQGLPIALSDAALKCLTKLTCLQLHVRACMCPHSETASYHMLYADALVAICCYASKLHCGLVTISFRSKCSSACAQEPEQELADGTMQPGITQLRHLARLHVGSHYGGTLCEFPPGFGRYCTTGASCVVPHPAGCGWRGGGSSPAVHAAAALAAGQTLQHSQWQAPGHRQHCSFR